jgi:hypothetical protein
MTDIAALRAANARRWAKAKLTRNFSVVARHLVSPDVRSRYQAVAVKTGVPWPVIAVIHERECSQDWTGSLAQGDPVGPDFGSRSRREGALQILGRGRDRCAEQLCAVCRTQQGLDHRPPADETRGI